MKDAYKNTLFNVIYGLAILIAVSTLFDYSELLFVVMVVMSFLVLKNNNIRHAPIHWLVGGIAFPIGEIICVYFGAWVYMYPDIFGVPLWLFPLWASVTVMIRKGDSEVFLDAGTRLKKWVMR